MPHHPTTTLAIGAVLLLAIAVVAIALLRRPRRSASPYMATPILTAHEAVFFPKLCEAAERVGAAGVFPQVSMAAIVGVAPHLDRERSRAVRNTFCQKRIDFVLVDEALRIMLIVELDDSSHDGPMAVAKDRERDAITKAAGYHTLRLRRGGQITVNEIERQMRGTLGR